jgi:biopolymer transport protein TolR
MQEFDADEDSITGINVTPLVDITLVLLIIFMVTARFISEPSVGVNLPKTSKGGSSAVNERNVFISLDVSGRLFLNNTQIDQSQLGERMAAMLKEKPDLNLVLRADKSVPHGDVMQVLDIVRAAGVTQFGIAVEAKAP